jgi:hypothetical protein
MAFSSFFNGFFLLLSGQLRDNLVFDHVCVCVWVYKGWGTCDVLAYI